MAIAHASRQVAIAMRRQGRHASATDLLTHTAQHLNADTGHPSAAVLSAYTKLLCTALQDLASRARV
ncbi:hypothetical protein LDL08_39445 [Nonomuraea glycinis]|uniref:Uncharacterized protein n=1 Tax=Nonomuraea glycinis TaxID=2047744 RepID=A0A918A8N2_9ACTN|nr:hypothetical protein [Nonomuraea glycinis]MCA2182252.1 hypothetical protein [Nonomuraea glycinis]GGP11280.1 hypothetical protein GCM10012278_54240 [Nonomuraea glycinis]